MHKYLRIASHIALKGNVHRKSYIGSVGIRRDGTMVMAWNGSSAGTTIDRCPPAHAEARLARKLDWGSTVYVARTRKDDGRLAMAKPCRTCELALRRKGVKRVEYSISEHEYGVLEF